MSLVVTMKKHLSILPQPAMYGDNQAKTPRLPTWPPNEPRTHSDQTPMVPDTVVVVGIIFCMVILWQINVGFLLLVFQLLPSRAFHSGPLDLHTTWHRIYTGFLQKNTEKKNNEDEEGTSFFVLFLLRCAVCVYLLCSWYHRFIFLCSCYSLHDCIFSFILPKNYSLICCKCK